MAYVKGFFKLDILVFVDVLCVLVIGDPRLSYVKMTDTYIGHGYVSFRVVSAIQCCIACKADSLCVSVSYPKRNKTCQLNNRNPFDSSNVTTITSNDWTSYKFSIAPCTSPWILFNRHCYLVVTTNSTWEAAEVNCQSFGGHLVDFSDEAEHDFVFEAVLLEKTEHFWIGLNDIDIKGTLVYPSGAPLSYENFGVGQPDSAFERCVEVNRNRKWNDLSCDASKPSVCERSYY